MNVGQEYIDQNMAIFDAAFAALYGLVIFLAVHSVIAMINTLAIGVIERTREIGMLRAVGSTRGQVRRVAVYDFDDKSIREEVQRALQSSRNVGAQIANRIVNRLGPNIPINLSEEEGVSLAQVATAFLVAELVEAEDLLEERARLVDVTLPEPRAIEAADLLLDVVASSSSVATVSASCTSMIRVMSAPRATSSGSVPNAASRRGWCRPQAGAVGSAVGKSK